MICPIRRMTKIYVTGLIICTTIGCAAQNQSNARKPAVDAVAEAQTPRPAPQNRPEQKKTDKDDPNRFAATNAQPSSPVFTQQPDQGKITGFDFYRDPLNAKAPMQNFDEIMKADEAARPGVMDAQRKLTKV